MKLLVFFFLDIIYHWNKSRYKSISCPIQTINLCRRIDCIHDQTPSQFRSCTPKTTKLILMLVYFEFKQPTSISIYVCFEFVRAVNGGWVCVVTGHVQNLNSHIHRDPHNSNSYTLGEHFATRTDRMGEGPLYPCTHRSTCRCATIQHHNQ